MNLRSPAAALSSALLLSFALVDCTSAEPHEAPPECDEIASLCHAAGEIDAEAEHCHEQAHEGDLEVCLDIQDECLALCEAVLGAGGAGGQGGATH